MHVHTSKHPNAEMLYHFAVDFLALEWRHKLTIGWDLGILDDMDVYATNDDLEHKIFTEAYKQGILDKLVKMIYETGNE